MRIHPTFVVGPTLVGEMSSSVGVVAKILSGELKGLPDVQMGMVDIRDVAMAHFIALTKEGIHG